jgi:hypothetical protein
MSEETDALQAVFCFTPKQSKIMSYPPTAMMSGCRCGARLDETLIEKDHFSVKSKAGIHHEKFSGIYPLFAVLLGGTAGCLMGGSRVILSDEDPDADSDRLQKNDGDLTQSCITKQSLEFLLQCGSIVEPLCARRRQLQPQQVMSWRRGGGCSIRHPNLFPKSVEFSGGSSVSAQIEMVPSNLVEHSLTLFIEITERGVQKSDQLPKWRYLVNK